MGGLWFHAEETAAHVDHLPCQEQCKPCETSESGASSPKYEHAFVGNMIVAIMPEIAVTKTENHDRERCKTKGCHPATIDQHVNEHFLSKDTDLAL